MITADRTQPSATGHARRRSASARRAHLILSAAGLLGPALLALPPTLAAPVWSAPAMLFETADEIYEPTMAVGPSGMVDIAWSVHGGNAVPSQRIYLTRFDGQSWSPASAAI